MFACAATQVRYESRQRLAETRPQVRGQFVKQKLSEGKAIEGKQELLKANSKEALVEEAWAGHGEDHAVKQARAD